MHKLVCICLLAIVGKTASEVCHSGPPSMEKVDDIVNKGCRYENEKVHIQQDSTSLHYSIVCSPVFTCSEGTFPYVDVTKCRVLCKICDENHFEPEETMTNRSRHPACRNARNRCDQHTKTTCWPNSPTQDDTCRCDWMKGYRPQNKSCHHGCYTQEDKSCGSCVKDTICKEGEKMNETYHCTPSMVEPSTAPSASQHLNGISTWPAPGVPNATTMKITTSTPSTTSPAKSAVPPTAPACADCPRDAGPWKDVAIAFIVLFLIALIVAIGEPILIMKWRVPKTQQQTAIEAQRIKELELECSAYHALWKNNSALLNEMCVHVKQLDKFSLKNEMIVVDMPEEESPATKRQFHGKGHSKSKNSRRTQKEFASKEELEPFMLKVKFGGDREEADRSQDSFPESRGLVTSMSSIEKDSSMSAVSMRDPQGALGATGGVEGAVAMKNAQMASPSSIP